MKADQGRPYKKPSNPTKVFMFNNTIYEVFIKDTVELFQINNDNCQRLVMTKDDYYNFEQLITNNGFSEIEYEAV